MPFLTSWLRKVVCLCAKCKQKCHQRFPYGSVINKLSGEKNKQITAYIVITANKHGLKAKKDKQRITSNILLFVLYSFIPRSIINISLSRRVPKAMDWGPWDSTSDNVPTLQTEIWEVFDWLSFAREYSKRDQQPNGYTSYPVINTEFSF